MGNHLSLNIMAPIRHTLRLRVPHLSLLHQLQCRSPAGRDLTATVDRLARRCSCSRRVLDITVVKKWKTVGKVFIKCALLLEINSARQLLINWFGWGGRQLYRNAVCWWRHVPLLLLSIWFLGNSSVLDSFSFGLHQRCISICHCMGVNEMWPHVNPELRFWLKFRLACMITSKSPFNGVCQCLLH